MNREKMGLTIAYFGGGKGKTTAALGLVLRASGAGKKVKVIQFVKGDWPSSEEKAIRNLKGVALDRTGLGFVGIKGDEKKIEDHRKAALRGLKIARQSLGKYDVIVCDEILAAAKVRLIKIRDVVDLIEKKPRGSTLVLTGAPKIEEVIKQCDLATEMKKIKHPFDRGVVAIEGIDY